MSSKDIIRLRWFTYGTCIVLWVIAICLIAAGNFNFFSGMDWIVYFATALAWATGGSTFLLWKHRRDVNPKPQEPGGWKLNWTQENGIFAPRETTV